MIKKIYINKLGAQVNQRLATLIINEQLSIWDKNNIRK